MLIEARKWTKMMFRGITIKKNFIHTHITRKPNGFTLRIYKKKVTGKEMRVPLTFKRKP